MFVFGALRAEGATHAGRMTYEPRDIAPVVDATHGESLIVVVGTVFETKAAAEAYAEATKPSHLQGYYVTSTDSVDVVGLYEQANARLVSRECGPDGRNGCYAQDEGTYPSTQRPVLRRVEQSSAAAAVASDEPSCGEIDHRPCRREWHKAVDHRFEFPSGKWVALSAFRTKTGAEDFVQLMTTANSDDPPVAVQIRNRNATGIGLGQEPHPDGTGPLVSPLPNQERYQQ